MKQLIKKILKEQTEETKVKKLIEIVANDIILPTYKHILCDIEVISPSDRKASDPNYRYEQFRVTIFALGGKGTRYWPETMGIRDLYDKLMNEIWDTIHDYTGGIAVDMYLTKLNKNECEKCQKKQITESKLSNDLLKIINDEGIFEASKIIGGIDNLKIVFKNDPTILNKLNNMNGKVKVSMDKYYPESLSIVLPFDIVDIKKNRWLTREWASVNVKYDKSKLTKEENTIFKAYIHFCFEIFGIFKTIQLNLPELKSKVGNEFIELGEINGEKIGNVPDGYESMTKDKIINIINKLKN
jgi:hypothetical protein